MPIRVQRCIRTTLTKAATATQIGGFPPQLRRAGGKAQNLCTAGSFTRLGRLVAGSGRRTISVVFQRL